MSKVYLTLGFGLISVGMALPAFAGVTFGDPKSDTGALTISGALRGIIKIRITASLHQIRK